MHTISKKIAIIGLPGSGKSTFATLLGQIKNIPVHHLDMYMFSDGKKRDKDEFIAIQKTILNEESWIIEGCSISTFEMRFAQADTIICFKLPRLLCIWRMVKRAFIRETIGGCLEGINWELVRYTWNFDKKTKAGIKELRQKYPHVNFLEFKSSKKADNYLKMVKK